MLNFAPLDRAEQLKYLGLLVTSDIKDNADMEGAEGYIGHS